MKFIADVKSAGLNKFRFSGYVDVSTQITPPLEFTIDVNKCDQGMKKCEKNPTQKLKKPCQRLTDTRAFYYPTLTSIQPKIECPIIAQRYTATNATLDLSPFTYLPINGYIWVISLKLFSGIDKARELAMCVEINLKTSKTPNVRKRIDRN